MALRFVEETHQYFDGDVELPSVTEIIRFCNFDTVNKARQGNNPFYRERGSKVHELCQLIDYDGIENVPVGTGYDGYIRAYINFLRDYNIKSWLAVEKPLGSANIGFAGTVDRIGYIDDKLTILDIKTSSNVNVISLTAQLTAYSLLNSSISAQLMGLQLKKDGKYKVILVDRDYELFKSCQTLHERFKKRGK